MKHGRDKFQKKNEARKRCEREKERPACDK